MSGSLILQRTSLTSLSVDSLPLQYCTLTSAEAPGAMVPLLGSTLSTSLLPGLRMSKLKAYGYLPAVRPDDSHASITQGSH